MDISSSTSSTTLNDGTSNLEKTLPEWTYTGQIVFIAIIAAVGIPGNSIVVFVQCKNRDKSSTDYLVLAMAIFELLCSGVNTSLYILRNLELTWKIIASDFICRTHYFTITVTSMSCTLLLTAIALDRYVQTCRPFSTQYGTTKAKRLCVLVAFVSILCAVPTLGVPAMDTKTLECYIDSHTESVFMYDIVRFLTGVAFFLMFIVVLVCNVRITLMLRRRHQQKVVAKFFRTNQIETPSLSIPTRIPGRNKVQPERASVAIRNEPLAVNTAKKISSIGQVNNESSSSNVVIFCKSTASNQLAGKQSSSNSDISQLRNSLSVAPSEINVLAHSPSQQEIRKLPRSVQRDDRSVNNEEANSADKKDFNQKTTNIKDRERLVGDARKDNVTLFVDVEGQRRLFKQEKKLNRTTLIMFLITIIYIVSWLTHWLVFGISSSETFSGRMARQLAQTSFMINCMTNPVFYICLSSTFRKNTRQLLCTCNKR